MAAGALRMGEKGAGTKAFDDMDSIRSYMERPLEEGDRNRERERLSG